ncbi:late protein 1 [Callithrix penicillata papillomavirus type 1]|uniref:Major capsid protein L1 n=1 Tax=Callithrix penicillata papillomavirus type 1 TaxID=2704503 RepID=A0A6C0TC72_9PAPI|nr:late protein 1 [Callithrix penicillata papillomavirus type 1]
MAVWLPSGKLFLPPTKPTTRVLQTDEYVRGTNLFFHAGSERLLTVGHPYFPILKEDDPTTVLVPKVSANQYRVFRLKFPDPNKFALIDQGVYNPDTERLVWRLRGIEMARGGPIGIGTTGHPLFNKHTDTENPNAYVGDAADDERQNVSFDPKQVQLFIVGCAPPLGQHWDKAIPCASDNQQAAACPPLELKTTIIEDGDMGELGFGALNFKALQEDKAGVPLELVNSTSKWPDFMKMSKDIYGDQAFFFGRREQMYVRHMWNRNGQGEPIGGVVDPKDYLVNPNGGDRATIGSHIYFPIPSGSLATSEAQLFNRPYWLQRAQGTNNGILWGNQAFVTIMDNTRGTNYTISVATDAATENYKASNYKQYLRHTEEYEFEVIVQLCAVPLNSDVLAHLNVMNPNILDDWNLAYIPPAPAGMEDTYRYLSSLATKCPDQVNKNEKEDPYAKYNFWEVDLTEKLSSELSQYSLGRRFIFQTGLISSNGGFKRVRRSASTQRKTTKRRRTTASK